MNTTKVIIMAVMLSFLILALSQVAYAGCHNTNQVFNKRSLCKSYCGYHYGVQASYHSFSHINVYMFGLCI